jgi:hypothetical protein
VGGGGGWGVWRLLAGWVGRSLGLNCAVQENIRCYQLAITRVAITIVAPALLRKAATLVSLLLDPWIMHSLSVHFNNLWHASLKSR